MDITFTADESTFKKPGHSRTITYQNMTKNDFAKSQIALIKNQKNESKERMTALPSVRKIKMLMQQNNKKRMSVEFPRFTKEHIKEW